MAWIKYNPNPKRDHGNDCTVRALAKAAGIPWEEAYLRIAVEGLIRGDMPSTNDIWGAALERLGFQRYQLPRSCPMCYTVQDFAAEHPIGTYICCTGSHTVALSEGDWFDSWDSGQEPLAFCYIKEDTNERV